MIKETQKEMKEASISVAYRAEKLYRPSALVHWLLGEERKPCSTEGSTFCQKK